MRPRRREPAERVYLSPSLTAVIYGRGHVLLLRGGDRSFTMNETEAATLAEAIADWQRPEETAAE